jgi:hypothetical protein
VQHLLAPRRFSQSVPKSPAAAAAMTKPVSNAPSSQAAASRVLAALTCSSNVPCLHVLACPSLTSSWQGRQRHLLRVKSKACTMERPGATSITLYPVQSYTFGTKNPKFEKDSSVTQRMDRLKEK